MKSALVVGAGLTGVSICRFLSKKDVEVCLLDDNIGNLPTGNAYRTIKSIAEISSIPDIIAVSPGVRTVYNPHPVVLFAHERKIKIWTDLDIMQHYYNKARYIGITGTNGKSTTADMLHHVMKHCGLSTYLCGNIGIPMLDVDKEYDYFIIELSSYQLENAHNINIDLGAILNIMPSHLDHHGDFEAYRNAKLRLLNSKEICFLDGRDFSTNMVLSHGISVVGGKIYKDGSFFNSITDIQNISSFVHHPQNLCVVISLALQTGLSLEQVVASLKSYKPLPHRTELICNIGRICFVNDSKATNIPAAIKAVSQSKDLVLIMGGKMLTDYSMLDDFMVLKDNIRKVFLIGESADFLGNKLTANGILNTKCDKLEDAAKSAYKHAITLTKNNKFTNFTIMLCPMHPALDQFVNFEDRGSKFKHIVSLLQ